MPTRRKPSRRENPARREFAAKAAGRSVAEGHETQSVQSLRLAGIDNGALYKLAAREYDLCFTRDAEFAQRVRDSGTGTHLKLLRVIIPQTRQEIFVGQFLAAFRQTDWSQYATGEDWPRPIRVLDS